MQTITPIFGRVFVKAIKQNRSSIIFTRDEVVDNRGVVIENGESKDVRIGDIVIYNKRFARYINLNEDEIISVDEKDIEAVVK